MRFTQLIETFVITNDQFEDYLNRSTEQLKSELDMGKNLRDAIHDLARSFADMHNKSYEAYERMSDSLLARSHILELGNDSATIDQEPTDIEPEMDMGEPAMDLEPDMDESKTGDMMRDEEKKRGNKRYGKHDKHGWHSTSSPDPEDWERLKAKGYKLVKEEEHQLHEEINKWLTSPSAQLDENPLALVPAALLTGLAWSLRLGKSSIMSFLKKGAAMVGLYKPTMKQKMGSLIQNIFHKKWNGKTGVLAFTGGYGLNGVFSKWEDAQEWFDETFKLDMDKGTMNIFAQAVVKYGIPIGGIVAILYGGKQLKDYMARDDEEKEKEKGNTTINNYYNKDKELPEPKKEGVSVNAVKEGPCDVATKDDISKMSGTEYDKYAQWKKDCESDERTTPSSTQRLSAGALYASESYDDYEGDMSKEDYDKTVKNTEMEYTVWVGGTEVNGNWLNYEDAVALYDKYKEQGYDDIQLDARIKDDHVSEETTEEGNEFSGELAKAKIDGKKEFKVGGKKYKVEEDESEGHPYIVFHTKKGKFETHADTSYDAAKKAAAHWKLKSTGGLTVKLSDVEHVADADTHEDVLKAPDKEQAIDARDNFMKVMDKKPRSGNKAIDTIKQIVADKQNMQVKFDDGKMKVDLYTASAISQVYDAVKPETQAKIDDMIRTKDGLLKMSNFAFKSMSEGKMNEIAPVVAVAGTVARAVGGAIARNPKKSAQVGAALLSKDSKKEKARKTLGILGKDEVGVNEVYAGTDGVTDKNGKVHDPKSPKAKMIINMKKKPAQAGNPAQAGKPAPAGKPAKSGDEKWKFDPKTGEMQKAKGTSTLKKVAGFVQGAMAAATAGANYGGQGSLKASKYAESKAEDIMKTAMEKVDAGGVGPGPIEPKAPKIPVGKKFKATGAIKIVKSSPIGGTPGEHHPPTKTPGFKASVKF